MIEYSVMCRDFTTSKWHLVPQSLNLRREVFMHRKKWSLNAVLGMEFDQYDTHLARYILAHRGDELLGSARLIRTDMIMPASGPVRYSYMIRDAYLGLLDKIPQSICDEEPPVSAKVWELTRLAVSSDADRHIGKGLLGAVNRFLADQGASECLFLSAPSLMEMAKRMGYKPKPMGPLTNTVEKSVRDEAYLAFSCEVRGYADA